MASKACFTPSGNITSATCLYRGSHGSSGGRGGVYKSLGVVQAAGTRHGVVSRGAYLHHDHRVASDCVGSLGFCPGKLKLALGVFDALALPKPLGARRSDIGGGDADGCTGGNTKRRVGHALAAEPNVAGARARATDHRTARGETTRVRRLRGTRSGLPPCTKRPLAA